MFTNDFDVQNSVELCRLLNFNDTIKQLVSRLLIILDNRRFVNCRMMGSMKLKVLAKDFGEKSI